MMIIKNLSAILLFSFFTIACSDNTPLQDMPSVVSFKTLQNATDETSTLGQTQIILDHAQQTDTYVYFSVGGTAMETRQTRFGTPDYHLFTTSPVVIPAGQTSETINYRILQDSLYEAEEHLVVEILGIGSGNAILHHMANQLVYTHFIFEEHTETLPNQQGDLIKAEEYLVKASKASSPTSF